MVNSLSLEEIFNRKQKYIVKRKDAREPAVPGGEAMRPVRDFDNIAGPARFATD
jgi:hypothetical protein